MTLGERIKKIRKDNEITQQTFAKKIGSTQNVLANYETDRRNPSGSVINNICKTFNINEEWLRNGTGEMYTLKATTTLKLLAIENNLTNNEYLLIEKFLNLKPGIRRALIDYIKEVATALLKNEQNSSLNSTTIFELGSKDKITRGEKPVKDWTEQDIEDEVEEYRCELLAEKKQAEKSSDLSDTNEKMA